MTRKQLSPARELAEQGPAGDVVEPEVLMLQADNRTIVSDIAPGTPLYHLTANIVGPQDATAAAAAAASTSTGPYITFERATASSGREPLFHLLRADDPADTFYLSPASPYAPGHIELRLSPPQQQQPGRPSSGPQDLRNARLEALLHLSGSGAAGEQQQQQQLGPALLAAMRPRWLSTTELNYLDAGGRQLACEDRDGGAHRLVTTVPMPGRVRDWLVAVWCLRIWREERQGQGRQQGQQQQQQQQQQQVLMLEGRAGGVVVGEGGDAAGYASVARMANVALQQAFGGGKGMPLHA